MDEKEIEPFEIEEIQALMRTALARRNGVRFVLALAVGTRKGETLGFRDRLNTNTKILRVSKQRRVRITSTVALIRHGAPTGTRPEPCKPDCTRHKKCPPLCPADCTGHARYCPNCSTCSVPVTDVTLSPDVRTSLQRDHSIHDGVRAFCNNDVDSLRYTSPMGPGLLRGQLTLDMSKLNDSSTYASEIRSSG